jgi:ribonuclease HI
MLPKIDTFFNKSENNQKPIKIHPEFDYKLNFDGCSKGNPGLSGAGAVIYHHNKEIWYSDFFVGEKFTNNHAEYAGLILGLQQAKEMGIKLLKVEGDSELVINQMKGVYKCKSINLIDLYDKAKELERFFEKIHYCHVFRNKNKRADELSNFAINKYLKNIENHDDDNDDDIYHDYDDESKTVYGEGDYTFYYEGLNK